MSTLADLTGRIVLVTGAGGGLGAAHARTITAQGGTVIATDLAVPPVAAELGPDHLGLAHDVTDRSAWDAVVAQAVERYGRIDGLVNNAGLCRYAPFRESNPALFASMMAVNLYGPLHGMQAVVPHMPEGGSIVNVSSIAGLYGWPNSTAYAASKHAVRGLTHAAAAELGRSGIRVNTVCPGAADTAMLSEESRAGGGVVATLPIARAARPEEVSAMVTFLLSDSASYCTGQDYIVDGGMKA
ncbi:MAG: SDR family oxidoreductase [Nocardioides sp.]|uniref:SDR family NAD(P)-dependent oxidoreductase n=1 Tax=Nocardioides sp. TaxID=35761 RepID=UPI0039E6F9E9